MFVVVNQNTQQNPARPIESKMNEPKKCISDYELLNLIGEGAYANVFKALQKDNNQYVAIKQLDKSMLVKLGKAQYALSEKQILSAVNHPNVIKLFATFQDETSLYFALELCSNGELLDLLQKIGKFTEQQTKFYAAELLLAVEHLHSKNIIHRDIKPENLLLDEQFHLKLADFSSAKMFGPSSLVRASSFCGTTEYIPPELLTSKGVGKMGDIWAFGCVIYQMICGYLPFKADTEFLTLQTISKCCPDYPEHLSNEIKDLLSKIFVSNPQERIGSVGYEEIKSHPFFTGVDWDRVSNATPPL